MSAAASAAGDEVARRAEAAGVSQEAVELVVGSPLIDLHLETYLQRRIFGTHLGRRQERTLLRGHRFGHLDFVRALEGGLRGAMWSLATNVVQPPGPRWRAFERTYASLRRDLSAAPGITVVGTASELRRALGGGQHGAMLAVQGGNVFEGAPELRLPADLVRVTLMHLTDSVYGSTSSPMRLPWRGQRGLTAQGRALVEALDAARVFVDLAHVDRAGFWDAVDVHDPSLPLIVTHTGVNGVKPHWRNLDDDQLRAVAETGGVVGVMFAPPFLRPPGGPRDGRMVVAHLEHIERVAGAGVAALGSDYDGFITPPADLRDGSTAYYRVVQRLLEAGWSPERIQGVLGVSFLRCFETLRP
ncbi:MAG: dipeptidase [Sandaracinaceae bacterium]